MSYRVPRINSNAAGNACIDLVTDLLSGYIDPDKRGGTEYAGNLLNQAILEQHEETLFKIDAVLYFAQVFLKGAKPGDYRENPVLLEVSVKIREIRQLSTPLLGEQIITRAAKEKIDPNRENNLLVEALIRLTGLILLVFSGTY